MDKVSIQAYLAKMIKDHKVVETDTGLLRNQCISILKELNLLYIRNLNVIILETCLKESSTLSTLLSTISIQGLLSNMNSIESKLLEIVKDTGIEIEFNGSSTSYHETIQLLIIINEKRNDFRRSKRIFTIPD